MTKPKEYREPTIPEHDDLPAGELIESDQSEVVEPVNQVFWHETGSYEYQERPVKGST